MKNPYRFDCAVCLTRCGGISKKNYIFVDDVSFSEQYENAIIAEINSCTGFTAVKPVGNGYPDIEISKNGSGIAGYLEIKAQRRTFMSVAKLLPHSDLIASETIALNSSDLERYFKLRKELEKPVFLVWFVENRPCITKDETVLSFYSEIKHLESVYLSYSDKRRFRRKSGEGDVVDGQHKGVVVNYHFSLNELRPFNINDLLRLL